MKKKTKIPVLFVLMILFIGSSGILQKRLISIQQNCGMSRENPLTDSPPLVAFTTMVLGGFRGLIADALWIRAGRMQQEGRYFELVQLAEWITQLEPRFGEVWAFQAWNLSYNISVFFSNPEDRYRWIQSGIELLRDQGLHYNPGDAQLYFELAWLYHHKIGGDTDIFHEYYKKQLNDSVEELFAHSTAYTNALQKLDSETTTAGLKPALMQQLQEQYGALDWRCPATHAIYWAMQGLPTATHSQKLQLERLIFQSMSASFFRSNSSSRRSLQEPRFDLLPYTLQAYRQAIHDFPENPSVLQAYEGFIQSAILVCYTYNRQQQAEKLFRELQKLAPHEFSDMRLDKFMLKYLAHEANEPSGTVSETVIIGLLRQSIQFKEAGENKRAKSFQDLAGLCWTNYMVPRNADSISPVNPGLAPLSELQHIAETQRKSAQSSPKSRN